VIPAQMFDERSDTDGMPASLASHAVKDFRHGLLHARLLPNWRHPLRHRESSHGAASSVFLPTN
jgi:hypothetical protein